MDPKEAVEVLHLEKDIETVARSFAGFMDSAFHYAGFSTCQIPEDKLVALRAAQPALSRVIEAAQDAGLYKKIYMKAVETAAPILQTGGQYSHLLLPGDSILERGPAVLAEALWKAEAALEQAQRGLSGLEDRALKAEAFGRTLLEKLTALEQENAVLRAERDAEIKGTLALRQECGARPDETFPDFVRRLQAEAGGPCSACGDGDTDQRFHKHAEAGGGER